MAAFGDVLRGFGSVLNPQVAQELAAEDQRKQAMQGQFGMALLQNELQKQSPEYQMKLEALKNEKGFRDEIAALGENPEPAAIAKAATKWGKPEIAVSMYKSQEDRLARVQAAQDALETKRLMLEQNHELALQRLTDAKARDAATAEYRQAQLALQGQIAATNAELKRLGLGIQQQLADAKTTAAGQGKPIPAPLQKQLTETAGLADATDRFVDTFKPEFGGYKMGAAGELVNKYKLTFGDDTGQAAWWQDYNLHQAQVRNKLFGSALTATETAEWNKSAINPGMDPSEIEKNLKFRNKLEQRAIGRLMRGAAVTYNKDQIEAFTGRKVPAAGEDAPKADTQSPTGGLPKVSSDADFDKLPSGTEFLDPSGVKRRKP